MPLAQQDKSCLAPCRRGGQLVAAAVLLVLFGPWAAASASDGRRQHSLTSASGHSLIVSGAPSPRSTTVAEPGPVINGRYVAVELPSSIAVEGASGDVSVLAQWLATSFSSGDVLRAAASASSPKSPSSSSAYPPVFVRANPVAGSASYPGGNMFLLPCGLRWYFMSGGTPPRKADIVAATVAKLRVLVELNNPVAVFEAMNVACDSVIKKAVSVVTPIATPGSTPSATATGATLPVLLVSHEVSAFSTDAIIARSRVNNASAAPSSFSQWLRDILLPAMDLPLSPQHMNSSDWGTSEASEFAALLARLANELTQPVAPQLAHGGDPFLVDAMTNAFSQLLRDAAQRSASSSSPGASISVADRAALVIPASVEELARYARGSFNRPFLSAGAVVNRTTVSPGSVAASTAIWKAAFVDNLVATTTASVTPISPVEMWPAHASPLLPAVLTTIAAMDGLSGDTSPSHASTMIQVRRLLLNELDAFLQRAFAATARVVVEGRVLAAAWLPLHMSPDRQWSHVLCPEGIAALRDFVTASETAIVESSTDPTQRSLPRAAQLRTLREKVIEAVKRAVILPSNTSFVRRQPGAIFSDIAVDGVYVRNIIVEVDAPLEGLRVDATGPPTAPPPDSACRCLRWQPSSCSAPPSSLLPSDLGTDVGGNAAAAASSLRARLKAAFFYSDTANDTQRLRRALTHTFKELKGLQFNHHRVYVSRFLLEKRRPKVEDRLFDDPASRATSTSQLAVPPTRLSGDRLIAYCPTLGRWVMTTQIARPILRRLNMYEWAVERAFNLSRFPSDATTNSIVSSNATTEGYPSPRHALEDASGVVSLLIDQDASNVQLSRRPQSDLLQLRRRGGASLPSYPFAKTLRDAATSSFYAGAFTAARAHTGPLTRLEHATFASALSPRSSSARLEERLGRSGARDDTDVVVAVTDISCSSILEGAIAVSPSAEDLLRPVRLATPGSDLVDLSFAADTVTSSLLAGGSWRSVIAVDDGPIAAQSPPDAACAETARSGDDDTADGVLSASAREVLQWPVSISRRVDGLDVIEWNTTELLRRQQRFALNLSLEAWRRAVVAMDDLVDGGDPSVASLSHELRAAIAANLPQGELRCSADCGDHLVQAVLSEDPNLALSRSRTASLGEDDVEPVARVEATANVTGLIPVSDSGNILPNATTPRLPMPDDFGPKGHNIDLRSGMPSHFWMLDLSSDVTASLLGVPAPERLFSVRRSNAVPVPPGSVVGAPLEDATIKSARDALLLRQLDDLALRFLTMALPDRLYAAPASRRQLLEQSARFVTLRSQHELHASYEYSLHPWRNTTTPQSKGKVDGDGVRFLLADEATDCTQYVRPMAFQQAFATFTQKRAWPTFSSLSAALAATLNTDASASTATSSMVSSLAINVSALTPPFVTHFGQTVAVDNNTTAPQGSSAATTVTRSAAAVYRVGCYLHRFRIGEHELANRRRLAVLRATTDSAALFLRRELQDRIVPVPDLLRQRYAIQQRQRLTRGAPIQRPTQLSNATSSTSSLYYRFLGRSGYLATVEASRTELPSTVDFDITSWLGFLVSTATEAIAVEDGGSVPQPMPVTIYRVTRKTPRRRGDDAAERWLIHIMNSSVILSPIARTTWTAAAAGACVNDLTDVTPVATVSSAARDNEDLVSTFIGLTSDPARYWQTPSHALAPFARSLNTTLPLSWSDVTSTARGTRMPSWFAEVTRLPASLTRNSSFQSPPYREPTTVHFDFVISGPLLRPPSDVAAPLSVPNQDQVTMSGGLLHSALLVGYDALERPWTCLRSLRQVGASPSLARRSTFLYAIPSDDTSAAPMSLATYRTLVQLSLLDGWREAVAEPSTPGGGAAASEPVTAADVRWRPVPTALLTSSLLATYSSRLDVALDIDRGRFAREDVGVAESELFTDADALSRAQYFGGTATLAEAVAGTATVTFDSLLEQASRLSTSPLFRDPVLAGQHTVTDIILGPTVPVSLSRTAFELEDLFSPQYCYCLSISLVVSSHVKLATSPLDAANVGGSRFTEDAVIPLMDITPSSTTSRDQIPCVNRWTTISISSQRVLQQLRRHWSPPHSPRSDGAGRRVLSLALERLDCFAPRQTNLTSATVDAERLARRGQSSAAAAADGDDAATISGYWPHPIGVAAVIHRPMFLTEEEVFLNDTAAWAAAAAAEPVSGEPAIPSSFALTSDPLNIVNDVAMAFLVQQQWDLFNESFATGLLPGLNVASTASSDQRLLFTWRPELSENAGTLSLGWRQPNAITSRVPWTLRNLTLMLVSESRPTTAAGSAQASATIPSLSAPTCLPGTVIVDECDCSSAIDGSVCGFLRRCYDGVCLTCEDDAASVGRRPTADFNGGASGAQGDSFGACRGSKASLALLTPSARRLCVAAAWVSVSSAGCALPVFRSAMTFAAAEATCRAHGAHLPSLNTVSDMSLLRTRLSDHVGDWNQFLGTESGGSAAFWLGAMATVPGSELTTSGTVSGSAPSSAPPGAGGTNPAAAGIFAPRRWTDGRPLSDAVANSTRWLRTLPIATSVWSELNLVPPYNATLFANASTIAAWSSLPPAPQRRSLSAFEFNLAFGADGLTNTAKGTGITYFSRNASVGNLLRRLSPSAKYSFESASPPESSRFAAVQWAAVVPLSRRFMTMTLPQTAPACLFLDGEGLNWADCNALLSVVCVRPRCTKLAEFTRWPGAAQQGAGTNSPVTVTKWVTPSAAPISPHLGPLRVTIATSSTAARNAVRDLQTRSRVNVRRGPQSSAEVTELLAQRNYPFIASASCDPGVNVTRLDYYFSHRDAASGRFFSQGSTTLSPVGVLVTLFPPVFQDSPELRAAPDDSSVIVRESLPIDIVVSDDSLRGIVDGSMAATTNESSFDAATAVDMPMHLGECVARGTSPAGDSSRRPYPGLPTEITVGGDADATMVNGDGAGNDDISGFMLMTVPSVVDFGTEIPSSFELAHVCFALDRNVPETCASSSDAVETGGAADLRLPEDRTTAYSTAGVDEATAKVKVLVFTDATTPAVSTAVAAKLGRIYSTVLYGDGEAPSCVLSSLPSNLNAQRALSLAELSAKAAQSELHSQLGDGGAGREALQYVSLPVSSVLRLQTLPLTQQRCESVALFRAVVCRSRSVEAFLCPAPFKPLASMGRPWLTFTALSAIAARPMCVRLPGWGLSVPSSQMTVRQLAVAQQLRALGGVAATYRDAAAECGRQGLSIAVISHYYALLDLHDLVLHQNVWVGAKAGFVSGDAARGLQWTDGTSPSAAQYAVTASSSRVTVVGTPQAERCLMLASTAATRRSPSLADGSMAETIVLRSEDCSTALAYFVCERRGTATRTRASPSVTPSSWFRDDLGEGAMTATPSDKNTRSLVRSASSTESRSRPSQSLSVSKSAGSRSTTSSPSMSIPLPPLRRRGRVRLVVPSAPDFVFTEEELRLGSARLIIILENGDGFRAPWVRSILNATSPMFRSFQMWSSLWEANWGVGIGRLFENPIDRRNLFHWSTAPALAYQDDVNDTASPSATPPNPVAGDAATATEAAPSATAASSSSASYAQVLERSPVGDVMHSIELTLGPWPNFIIYNDEDIIIDVNSIPDEQAALLANPPMAEGWSIPGEQPTGGGGINGASSSALGDAVDQFGQRVQATFFTIPTADGAGLQVIVGATDAVSAAAQLTQMTAAAAAKIKIARDTSTSLVTGSPSAAETSNDRTTALLPTLITSTVATDAAPIPYLWTLPIHPALAFASGLKPNGFPLRIRVVPKRECDFSCFSRRVARYTTLGVVVIGALLGGDLSYLVDLQLMNIDMEADCSLEAAPIPFSLHPLQVPISIFPFRYFLGAAVCNATILCALLSIAWVVYLHHTVLKGRSPPFAMAMMHCPKLFLPFLLLLSPGIVSGSATILLYGVDAVAAWGYRLLGSLFLVGVGLGTFAILAPAGSGSAPVKWIPSPLFGHDEEDLRDDGIFRATHTRHQDLVKQGGTLRTRKQRLVRLRKKQTLPLSPRQSEASPTPSEVRSVRLLERSTARSYETKSDAGRSVALGDSATVRIASDRNSCDSTAATPALERRSEGGNGPARPAFRTREGSEERQSTTNQTDFTDPEIAWLQAAAEHAAEVAEDRNAKDPTSFIGDGDVSSFATLFYASGMWVDTDPEKTFLSRYGWSINDVRMNCRSTLLLSAVVLCFKSFILGVRPTGNGTCVAVTSAQIVVDAFYAMSLAYYRPFRRRVHNIVSIAAPACLAVGLVFDVVSLSRTSSSDGTEVSQGGYFVQFKLMASHCRALAAVVICCGVVPSIAMLIWSKLTGKPPELPIPQPSMEDILESHNESALASLSANFFRFTDAAASRKDVKSAMKQLAARDAANDRVLESDRKALNLGPSAQPATRNRNQTNGQVATTSVLVKPITAATPESRGGAGSPVGLWIEGQKRPPLTRVPSSFGLVTLPPGLRTKTGDGGPPDSVLATPRPNASVVDVSLPTAINDDHHPASPLASWRARHQGRVARGVDASESPRGDRAALSAADTLSWTPPTQAELTAAREHWRSLAHENDVPTIHYLDTTEKFGDRFTVSQRPPRSHFLRNPQRPVGGEIDEAASFSTPARPSLAMDGFPSDSPTDSTNMATAPQRVSDIVERQGVAEFDVSASPPLRPSFLAPRATIKRMEAGTAAYRASVATPAADPSPRRRQIQGRDMNEIKSPGTPGDVTSTFESYGNVRFVPVFAPVVSMQKAHPLLGSASGRGGINAEDTQYHRTTRRLPTTSCAQESAANASADRSRQRVDSANTTLERSAASDQDVNVDRLIRMASMLEMKSAMDALRLRDSTLPPTSPWRRGAPSGIDDDDL